jgi:phosphatidylglycerol:prolipoprotein diacylglycerol transferase
VSEAPGPGSRYAPAVIPLGIVDITPPSVAFHLGPVSVDFYGIGYALALAIGIWLTARQARLRREDPDHIGNGIIVVFVLGLIGARVYHLIDQWNTLYAQDPIKAILPPYTGLGIYGGIVGGIIGVVWYTRRHGLSFLRWADIAVPAVLVGQAIARWGNFFNQELYGPPTNLPWGIAIECTRRVAEYPCAQYPFATTGFHPLFFYESSLDLLGAVIAFWLAGRAAGRLRDGDLFSFWFIWYGAVRSILETMRIGYDWTFFGVPTAILVGLAAMVFGAVTIAWRHRGPGPSTADGDRARDEAAGRILSTGTAPEDAPRGGGPGAGPGDGPDGGTPVRQAERSPV